MVALDKLQASLQAPDDLKIIAPHRRKFEFAHQISKKMETNGGMDLCGRDSLMILQWLRVGVACGENRGFLIMG